MRKASQFDNFANIFEANSASSKNFNPALGEIDQLADGLKAVGDGRFQATGQNSADTMIDKYLECFEGIFDEIKGAMKDGLNAVGNAFEEGFKLRDLDVPVAVEEAKDEASGAIVDEEIAILEHDCKIAVAVMASARSGPNHGHDGQSGFGLD